MAARMTDAGRALGVPRGRACHRQSGEGRASNVPRRRFLRLAGVAAALPGLSLIAKAQSYPSRPVRLIVPLPSGGAADIVARSYAHAYGLPIAVTEAQPGFVFDEEHRFSPSEIHLVIFIIEALDDLVHSRQVNLEGSSLSYFTVNPKTAAALFDDAIDRRQTKSGSFTDFLGSKERFKNM